MTIKSLRILVTSCLIMALSLVSSSLLAGENDPVVYEGYFSREQNDGDMAEMSGKSHYVKFFPDNRFIRLYIPYPYSTTVREEDIHRAFDMVDQKYKVSAFIKDDFGIFEEKIIAHIDVYRRVNGEIMFDCGISAPCKILFDKELFKVIKKGIVKDHITLYHHVSKQ